MYILWGICTCFNDSFFKSYSRNLLSTQTLSYLYCLFVQAFWFQARLWQYPKMREPILAFGSTEMKTKTGVFLFFLPNKELNTHEIRTTKQRLGAVQEKICYKNNSLIQSVSRYWLRRIKKSKGHVKESFIVQRQQRPGWSVLTNLWYELISRTPLLQLRGWHCFLTGPLMLFSFT